jgi:hypothetical protein
MKATMMRRRKDIEKALEELKKDLIITNKVEHGWREQIWTASDVIRFKIRLLEWVLDRFI